MTQRVGIFGLTVIEDTSTNTLDIHALFVYDQGQVIYFHETMDPVAVAALQPLIQTFVDSTRLENQGAGAITPRDIGQVTSALEYSRQKPTDAANPPTIVAHGGLDINLSQVQSPTTPSDALPSLQAVLSAAQQVQQQSNATAQQITTLLADAQAVYTQLQQATQVLRGIRPLGST